MTLAFIFVNCNVDEGSTAERNVKKVRGVVESHETSGAYDIILKVKADTEAELRDIIKNIRKVRGVGAAITSIVYGNDQAD
ncbi:putative transcriptional regulator, AsnC family [Nitrososphaera viennensis EN76]|nr:putative transcriptional regulator, AsnC family [Nitrososphaera viennensis EN76]